MNISPEVIRTETLGHAGSIESLGSRKLVRSRMYGLRACLLSDNNIRVLLSDNSIRRCIIAWPAGDELSVGFINITVVNRSENSSSYRPNAV